MRCIGAVTRSNTTDERAKVNTVTDIAPLLQAIQSFGNWVLFFWLYMKERDRSQRISDEHKADLRGVISQVLSKLADKKDVSGQDATD